MLHNFRFVQNSDEPQRINLPFKDDALARHSGPKSQMDELFEQVENLNISTHVGVQHIGFKLHEEEFLMPVKVVREIIMLPPLTFVPKSKGALEGIIALRGEIMPVLNLRRYLGFPRGVAIPTTRVVILQHEDSGFGVLVDEITDFMWLQRHDVESIPQNFFSNEYAVLAGVAKQGETVRGVVDVARLVLVLSLGQESA